MAKKVVGVYDTEREVMEVVNRLEDAGYRPEDITLVAKNSSDSAWLQHEGVDTATTNDLTRSEQKEDESFWQKVKNAFTTDETDYSANEGFTSRFSSYGLSDDDAEKYDAEVQRGKMVVLAPESYTGAMNASTATEGVETSGVYEDPNLHSNIETDTHLTSDLDRSTEKNLKLREEELDIDKHEVSAGEADVRKEVHEEIKQVDVPVEREEIYVERKPVNEHETDTAARMEDESIRVPLKEEEIEVRKRPVVREEVEIGKKKVMDTEEVTDTVKHEELDVEMDNRDSGLDSDFIPENERSRAREYDVAYMKEDEIEDSEERRAKRQWDIDNNRDRF